MRHNLLARHSHALLRQFSQNHLDRTAQVSEMRLLERDRILARVGTGGTPANKRRKSMCLPRRR